MLALSLPFTLGSAAVGLVLARTAVNDPAALALLALPTFLIVAAYRAYTGPASSRRTCGCCTR